MTEDDLNTAVAALREAEPGERPAEEPYPHLPSPLADRYRSRRPASESRWSGTHAITPVVWGHLSLGDRRFKTRAEMLLALREVTT